MFLYMVEQKGESGIVLASDHTCPQPSTAPVNRDVRLAG